MDKQQKLTPKYWIAHDNTTDDVIIGTAAKMLSDCQMKTYQYVGVGWLGGTGKSFEDQQTDLINAAIYLEENYPEIEFRIFEVAYPKSEDFDLVAPKATKRANTHVPTDAETQQMHDTR